MLLTTSTTENTKYAIILRAHARLSKWGEIQYVKPISLSVTNPCLHNGVIEAMNEKE